MKKRLLTRDHDIRWAIPHPPHIVRPLPKPAINKGDFHPSTAFTRTVTAISVNEKHIIQGIVEGSKKAFEVLYNSFSAKVYNVALSYTKSVEDAEEITQDVFVKIHKHAAAFKGDSSIETWIYRITVNTSLNYLKKKNRFALFKRTYKSTPSIDFNHPGVLLERKDKAAALFKVIDSLPDRQKTAFILSYIEGLPRQEVANIMETSLKAIESLLQRAKQSLREKLEKIPPDQRK